MTLDRYSKVVLTVIALCLVWICMRDIPFVRPAQAALAQGRQDVRIVDVKMEGVRDDTAYSLPVRVQK